MAGGRPLDVLGRPRRGIGRQLVQDLIRDALNPKANDPDTILGQQFTPEQLNAITPGQAAALTGQLEGADTDTGFSGAQEAFDLIDIPGAFVRGILGAGVSAAQGEFGQAGERLLSALPGSENIPKLFGHEGFRAPEGSDILADLGFEKGTTAEDEFRIRIARAAGMTRSEAKRKFFTAGEPLDFDAQREFESLMQKAQERRPNIDLGINFDDQKNAIDAQDVAGFAVDILTDPLTYLSFGATSAGKAAKLSAQLGPDALKALRAAETLADARKVVEGAKVAGFGPKAKSRLLGALEDAFRTGKPDLELGRTLAEQSAKGQRAAQFRIPFADTPLSPEFSTGAIDQPLSVLGQSKLSREVFGADIPGVNRAVQEFMEEAPVAGFVTKTIRGALEGGRKLADKTGIKRLDEILKAGGAVGAEGAESAQRVLNDLNAQMRQMAKVSGSSLDEVRSTVQQAVELADAHADSAVINARAHLSELLVEEKAVAKQAAEHEAAQTALDVERSTLAAGFDLEMTPQLADKLQPFSLEQQLAIMDRAKKLPDEIKKAREALKDAVDNATRRKDAAAEFAATLSRTGLDGEEVSRVAAGFTKINNDMLDEAAKWGIPLTELTDESLSYMHRMLTGPGRDWIAANKSKLKDISGGAEFSVRSGHFKGRIEKWRGKTIKQINDEMEGVLGDGVKFFTEDPFAATTHAVHEFHRRVSNAYIATRIVDDFGQVVDEAAEGAEFTAKQFYDKLGLKYADEGPVVGHETVTREIPADVPFVRRGGGSKATVEQRGANAVDAFDLGARGEPLPGEFRSASRLNVNPRGIGSVKGLHGASQSETFYRWGKEIAEAKKAGIPLTRHQKRVEKAIGEARKSLPPLEDIKPKTITERVPVRGESEATRLARIAIPEELFNTVARIVDVQDAPGKLFRGYIKLTNFLKATVTTLFPAFHGRNMLENYFKAVFEGGGSIGSYKDATKILAGAQDLNMGGASIFDEMARGARRTFAKAGKPSDEAMALLKEETGFNNLDDFAAWAQANGLFENKFTSEFGVDMRNALLGRDPSAAQKSAEGLSGLLGTPLRGGYAVASGTENLHRLAFFLDRLKKGYGRAGALNEVKRVFFDYRNLGKMEDKLAKSFGFFYNFYRNNIRYIAQTALKHPVMSKQILRMFQDDPDNPRHGWLSDKGTFRVGKYDVALGFLPQQQFNMFDLAEGDVFDKISGKLGQAAGQANPLIGSAMNAAFGKDLYRDLPLEYVDRAPDWNFAPEWFKKTIGLRQTTDGGYVMSPKWRWAMNLIPALGRYAQSQIFFESDKEYGQKLAQMLAGVRIEGQDPDRDALARMQRNIDRAARDLPDLRKGAFGDWVTDRRTVDGRIKSTLTKQSPSKDDVVFLASRPEIMARLAPYVTIDQNGEPVVSRLLRDKMEQLAIELYPSHKAIMDAQRAQRAAFRGTTDPVEAQAQEAFAGLFGG